MHFKINHLESITSRLVRRLLDLRAAPNKYLVKQVYLNRFMLPLLAYGSLIFREGDQIVREGEYKSQEES